MPCVPLPLFLSWSCLRARDADAALARSMFILNLYRRYPELIKPILWASAFVNCLGMLAASWATEVRTKLLSRPRLARSSACSPSTSSRAGLAPHRPHRHRRRLLWSVPLRACAHVAQLVSVLSSFERSGGQEDRALTAFPLLARRWWVERRGLASGIVFSGMGVGGCTTPFILSGLLEAYGFPTMCRAWAAITAGVFAVSLFFLQPRVPLVKPKGERAPWVSLRDFKFATDPVVLVMVRPRPRPPSFYLCLVLPLPRPLRLIARADAHPRPCDADGHVHVQLDGLHPRLAPPPDLRRRPLVARNSQHPHRHVQPRRLDRVLRHGLRVRPLAAPDTHRHGLHSGRARPHGVGLRVLARHRFGVRALVRRLLSGPLVRPSLLSTSSPSFSTSSTSLWSSPSPSFSSPALTSSLSVRSQDLGRRRSRRRRRQPARLEHDLLLLGRVARYRLHRRPVHLDGPLQRQARARRTVRPSLCVLHDLDPALELTLRRSTGRRGAGSGSATSSCSSASCRA